MSQSGHPLFFLLLLDDGALILQELFQMKLFPVKNSVGKVAYPVAEADYPAILGNLNVEGNVSVTKNEKFNFRIFLNFLSGELNLVLIFNSQEFTHHSVF